MIPFSFQKNYFIVILIDLLFSNSSKHLYPFTNKSIDADLNTLT